MDFRASAVYGVGRDAPHLATALTQDGWQVCSLLSSQERMQPAKEEEAPTEANLRRYLKGLADLKAEDDVVVVLIGHLAQLESGKGKGEGRLYFCPQDGVYEGLEKDAEVTPRHHLLPLDEVYDFLAACPARQKLLVLVVAPGDWGKAENFPPPLCRQLPRLPPPPDRLAVLTSCAESESTASHCQFVYTLALGLTHGHADGEPDYTKRDGAVTAEELIAFVQARAQALGENGLGRGLRAFPQHPQVLGRLPHGWVLARDHGWGDWQDVRRPGKALKELLAVQAFNPLKTRFDLAADAASDFVNGPRDLAKELTRQEWDCHHWASGWGHRPPPDEVPTEVNLRRYLQALPSLRPGDEVLVLLVGQLVSLEQGEAGKRGPRLYFCPEDAEYEELTKADEVRPAHHLLPLEDIYAALQACPAQKKLLILVTALSGTHNQPENYPPPLCSLLPPLPPPPPGVPVVTGCAEGECCGSRADFPSALFEGLAGLKADGASDGQHRDGAVTAEELIAWASNVAERRERRQHPNLLGRLPRDWVLAGQPADNRWKLLSVPFPADEARRRQAEVAHALNLDGPVLSNSLGMKLVVIPPGECRLGSDQGYDDERPRPLVRLSRPFLLGQHEVTQGQYEQVRGDNPSFFRQVPGQDTAAFPVEQVTFQQAVLFCNALSEREKLPPYYRLFDVQRNPAGQVVAFRDYLTLGGAGYRLPTEAEWEYACRAGSDQDFYFGKEIDGRQANVDAGRPGGVREGAYLGRPTPVGSYAANAWGLYDMHGNVAERCEETYDPRRYRQMAGVVTDGSGGIGWGGLVRGGAWNFAPVDCRSAVRLALPPGVALKFVGFRVARDAE